MLRVLLVQLNKVSSFMPLFDPYDWERVASCLSVGLHRSEGERESKSKAKSLPGRGLGNG